MDKIGRQFQAGHDRQLGGKYFWSPYTCQDLQCKVTFVLLFSGVGWTDFLFFIFFYCLLTPTSYIFLIYFVYFLILPTFVCHFMVFLILHHPPKVFTLFYGLLTPCCNFLKCIYGCLLTANKVG